MIPIPKSLTIDRVEKGEKFLLKKSREFVEKSSGDRSKEKYLHASDCLDPRMAYFTRRYPGPIPDRLVPIFLIGRILHSFIICGVEGKPFSFDADGGSSTSKRLRITYSPDMVINGIPREIKTSRSFYEPKEIKDLSMYCEQLLIYMAAMGKTEGDLWVLFMNAKENGKTSPAFRVYKIRISKQDLARTQAYLEVLTKDFERAMKTKNHKILPKCRPFKCGKKECEFWDKCKPEGRYGLPDSRWRKNERELTVLPN